MEYICVVSRETLLLGVVVFLHDWHCPTAERFNAAYSALGDLLQ
jgi:hypothetical protein